MRLLPLPWLLLLVVSCSRGEEAPRMWQPSDHDHTTEAVSAARPAAPDVPRSQPEIAGQDASAPAEAAAGSTAAGSPTQGPPVQPAEQ
jgi:hypothetical protein